MNIDLSATFAEATINVISTMALLECKPGDVFLKREGKEFSDVTGLIGLSGEDARGVFAISFPKHVIFEITERMLGDAIYEIDDTVTDMVGELTNMISGKAKQLLSTDNYSFGMALPIVIAGEDHQVVNKSRGVMVVPITSAVGEFFIEICFETTL